MSNKPMELLLLSYSAKVCERKARLDTVVVLSK